TPLEQPLTLPAASVAVALKVVDESSATATVIPVANAAAVPGAVGAPVQVAVVYSLTVEPASAVPLIAGALLLAGPAGVAVRPEGLTGAVEPSRTFTPRAQPLTLPAASVAVALKVVDESSETATVIPVANAAAVPVAVGAPVQAAVVYSFTVEPASAGPLIAGELLLAGPAGVAASPEGLTGAVESSTY